MQALAERLTVLVIYSLDIPVWVEGGSICFGTQ